MTRPMPILRPLAFALVAALTASPALAQRAPDDARPGGVELRPAPPAPAAADMAPPKLFSKPTVSPPVLPTPAPAPPAAAPAAAAVPAAPATPPPVAAPAADKGQPAPAATPTGAGSPDTKADPKAGDSNKKLEKVPADGMRTRSFRAAPPPPAGAAGSSPPMPPGSMKGNDTLPGGVERAPQQQ